jgi:hypothetical protein
MSASIMPLQIRKIDTRGHGGFVVAAGSRRTTGRYVGDGREIAELPGWLTELLVPLPQPRVVEGPRLGSAAAARYVAAIVQDETARLAAAAPGTRYAARLRAGRVLGELVGGGEIDPAAARATLLSAAETHLGGDTSRRRIESDIDDAVTFGARRPRRITR